MMDALSKIFEQLVSKKKGIKALAWIFICVLLLMIIFYPIIDANFLYYNRANKRIDIVQKIVELDKEEIKKDKRLEEEYNSILNDMNKQDDNYINNIFVKETSQKNNIIKFVSGFWMFALIAIILPFWKDKNTGERFVKINIISAVLCLAAAFVMGYACVAIPNIINMWVNVILYEIILVFLAYTISTSGNKDNSKSNTPITKEATNE